MEQEKTETFENLSHEELMEKAKKLEEKEKDIEKKERELSVLEASITASKHNLYDKINVSVKTMNIFIGVLVVLLVLAIVAAIVYK